MHSKSRALFNKELEYIHSDPLFIVTPERIKYSRNYSTASQLQVQFGVVITLNSYV